MGEFFRSGGFMMWPLTAAAVLVAVSAVRALLALRAADGPPERARGVADSVLFWGGVAASLGVLGTIAGLAQVARAVSAAGQVSAALAWSGVGVTLVTTIAGLVVLLVALLVWYALRARAGRHA